MSSSTVRFKGAEFSAYDLAIELWLLEVVRQIDGAETVEPWLRELRDEWYLQATAGFGFGVSPAPDRFVGTRDRSERLADLSHRSLAALAKRSGDFAPEEMNGSGVGGPGTVYSRPFPTAAVIEVGERFAALLSQE